MKDLKEQISSRAGIPADRQRLIICGRVLSDEKKLSEYELDGRVVHLVQRPPPGPSNEGGDRLVESHEARARRRDRARERFDQQGQDQSSPLVRLNLTKDMIRNANRMMDGMEEAATAESSPERGPRPSTETRSAMGGGGGGGFGNLKLGGDISVRVENGRVVAEAASSTTASPGEANTYIFIYFSI